MKIKILLNAAVAVMLGGVLAPAYSQDITAGETIYESVCKNCHGRTAKGMASFPKLSGNTAEYLVMRLEQYRAKEKLGPNAPLMWPLAVDLSDDDIANIAAYISTTFE
ncbi:MAG: cytochrome c553 [Granulosicoccus sp.]|jgi:cytochrome c553